MVERFGTVRQLLFDVVTKARNTGTSQRIEHASILPMLDWISIVFRFCRSSQDGQGRGQDSKSLANNSSGRQLRESGWNGIEHLGKLSACTSQLKVQHGMRLANIGGQLEILIAVPASNSPDQGAEPAQNLQATARGRPQYAGRSEYVMRESTILKRRSGGDGIQTPRRANLPENLVRIRAWNKHSTKQWAAASFS